MKTDVLVIGSGIAGLSFAIKIAEARADLKVTVLTKIDGNTSNTAQAQGGIAVVLDRVKDSFEQHIQDTLKAGKNLNDKEVVELVISQAPDRLEELIEWGTSFDADDLGKFDLGLEGGHSQRRIVHHRDLTGLELQRKLLKQAHRFSNIELIDHFLVVDLLIDQNSRRRECIGVRAGHREKNELLDITSKITFLATGGSGMIFSNTTNPSVATGDGVAMAYRAGAEIKDMQYIQFHPTALYEEGKNPLFLISEAVRGFGAYIVNQQGNRFLFKADMRGELATRDVVSEAIVKEMKFTGQAHVYLDCRHLDFESFQNEFPTIVAYCLSIGIDVKTDLIPIVPAAHYQCGGIHTDLHGRSTIPSLYASGECAHTGLHGANRLASNSLLEALVFSHQAAVSVLSEIDFIQEPEEQQEIRYLEPEAEADDEIIESLKLRLNEIMSYDIVHASQKRQKTESLENLEELKEILENYPLFNSKTPAFYELRNMVQVAILVLEHAIEDSSQKRRFTKASF